MIAQLLTGLLLGLAGSLHCAGMCGPLVCTVNLSLGGEGNFPAMARVHATLNAGRIGVQMALGGLAGGIGGSVLWLASDSSAFAAAHVAMALTLAWAALGLLGVVPGPGVLRRFVPRPAGLPLHGSAAAMGAAWGLMPCGMVFAALMLALFSGSVLGGAATMLGFGLGTLPALTAVLFGMRGMIAKARTRGWKRGAATVMLAYAFASLALPLPQWAGLCSTAGVP